MTALYNKSIQSGEVPLDWKKSHVTPVHKGGDASDPGNFRPISVVPVVAKILERLIANQLCGYLESHQLFHGHQGAYRCGRSSEQILLYAVDTVINSLDGGMVVCAAFLDLRKAFDSLDHALLLQRLHHLGICGAEIQWFSSYLSDRVQQVKCNKSYSGWGPVLGGIPKAVPWDPSYF